MKKIAITAIMAIALIGIVLISGCVQQGTNSNTGTNSAQQVSPNQVASEVNQQLIDENQTTVEIGDMV